MATTRRVLIFDGVCNLCNHVVQFVIRRDTHARIKSKAAQPLLTAHGISREDALKSFVLVEGNRVYRASTAAIQLARQLSFPYPLLAAAYIIPRPLRDAAYYLIANNRYAWFGNSTFGKGDDAVCMMPKPDVVRRFLDAEEAFPPGPVRRTKARYGDDVFQLAK